MWYLLLCVMKMIGCSGLLFTYYWFFLRERRFHQYNRYFLLTAAGLSLILPFVQVDLPFLTNTFAPPYQLNYGTPAVVYATGASIELSSVIRISWWIKLIVLIYGCGSLIGMLMLTRGLLYINKLKSMYPSATVDNTKVYFTDEADTPFSYFKLLFWNVAIPLRSKKGQQIFRHEQYHIQQHHSVDILAVKLISILFWFNPFFHLLLHELRTIHEYLADQHAVQEGEPLVYAETLVLHSMHTRKLPLSNYFFQHQLKRRIAMLTNTTLTQTGYASRVLALPMLVVLTIGLMAFTSEEKPANVPQNSSASSLDSSWKIETIRYFQRQLRIPDASTGNPTELVIAAKVQVDESGRFKSMTQQAGAAATSANSIQIVVVGYSQGTKLLNESVLYDEVQRVAKGYTLKDKGLGSYSVQIKFLLENTAARDTVPPKKSDAIFLKADILPSFPGGAEAWRTFLNKTLRYPQEAIDSETMGTVLVKFIVQKSGDVTDIVVEKDPGSGLGDAAKLLVQKSGKWHPAIQNGQPVACYFTQPVTFRMERQ